MLARHERIALRTITVAAVLVLLSSLTAAADAAFRDEERLSVGGATAGTIEMLRGDLPGLEPELRVDGLMPGETAVFGHRLRAGGSLLGDGEVVVIEVDGAERGCDSPAERAIDPECEATLRPEGDQGDLLPLLQLVLHVWDEADGGCAGAPVGAPLYDGPLVDALGVTSATFPGMTPDDAICVRGTVTLPEDASVAAHGDTVSFRTQGILREVLP